LNPDANLDSPPRGHALKRRPLAVTIIGWLFLAAGTVGFAYHLMEFKGLIPFNFELAEICLIRLLAVIASIFLLRGRNWARWLLLVWIAYHVILSAFHKFSEFAIHAALFAVVAWLLLRTRAADYFRNEGERAQSREAFSGQRG